MNGIRQQIPRTLLLVNFQKFQEPKYLFLSLSRSLSLSLSLSLFKQNFNVFIKCTY